MTCYSGQDLNSSWQKVCYSRDLKSGLVRILNGILTADIQLFEIQTSHHFVKNHLKFVRKCLDFEWSSLQMVGVIAKFGYSYSYSPTLQKLYRLKLDLQKVRIQIPTVFKRQD